MESLLRKRLDMLKSRARRLRDRYAEHRQYAREDYGPPCTLDEATPGREAVAGGVPFYPVLIRGGHVIDVAQGLDGISDVLIEGRAGPRSTPEHEWSGSAPS